MSDDKITHRCIAQIRSDAPGADYFDYMACTTVRHASGEITGGCGEPCDFIMGKGGSSEPDWGTTAEGYRVTPQAPDMTLDAPFLHLVSKPR